MKSNDEPMTVTIIDKSHWLGDRLVPRLKQVEELRCDEHGQKVVGVHIVSRENGWFDSRWTTCCKALEQKAVGIVKERC